MDSIFQIGKQGEERAEAYLKEMGFEIVNTPLKNKVSSFDILALKDKVLYAINVKTASKKSGLFGIKISNIPRLLWDCKVNQAIPVYMLLYNNKFVFFRLDKGFSNWKTNPEGTLVEQSKIIKFGNSLAAIFKKSIITKTFNWDGDTLIEVKYDEINKRIIIQKNGGTSG